MCIYNIKIIYLHTIYMYVCVKYILFIVHTCDILTTVINIMIYMYLHACIYHTYMHISTCIW